MGKKRILAIILALLAFLLCDVILFAVMTQRYPQRVILPEELYGSELENLKEFELGEDGLLTSQSTDPWILFPLEEETNVRQVTIYLSEVSEKGQRVDVFLEPTYCMESVILENGRISVSFASALTQGGVTGIRLDLTERENDAFRVERVVVNSWTSLALTILSLSLCVLALVAMVVAEILLWRRLLAPGWARSVEDGESRWRRWARLMPAAFQGLCKVAVVVGLCRYNLLFSDLGDHQRLLYWMLLLGTEGICLGALIIRCTGQRRNLPLCMALLPFWGVAQFAAVELLSISQFNFQSVRYLLLNVLWCCIPGAVLMVVLRWGALAITLSSALFTAWGLANHFYGALRENPLEYSDLAQAGTAANVVGNYDFRIETVTAAAVLAALAVSVCLFASLGRCCWKRSWKRESCTLAGVVAAVVVFCLGIPAFGLNQAWNISDVSEKYGYLLSFFSYAKAGLGDGKPDNYTAELADSILEEAAQTGGGETAGGADSDTPNVIVIMNEAFADLPQLYGFETNVDPLSNIHSMDNTITGTLLTSVFGGGTSNTEYEFLTGNSLFALPAGSCPYVQYMSNTQQSIAWRMQNLGYSVAGYHPYYGNGYRRDANYPLLGLDPFYDIEADLPGQEYLRSYLSDSSDFENVIWLYEQSQEDEPFFLFNVTMQNHGGYSASVPQVEVTVEPEDPELQLPALEEYLSLIYETDQAFAELTDYFSQVEEDTIILMFGDHQPGLGDTVMDQLQAQYSGDDDLVASGNLRYRSSFVIWANFDIEEASDVLTSPNYLRAMVLEQAGMELNAYESFLLQLQEEFPAMNAFSCLDSDGVWYDRGAVESQSLDDYACLVYNNVFDKKHMNQDYYN